MARVSIKFVTDNICENTYAIKNGNKFTFLSEDKSYKYQVVIEHRKLDITYWYRKLDFDFETQMRLSSKQSYLKSNLYENNLKLLSYVKQENKVHARYRDETTKQISSLSMSWIDN